MKFSSLEGIRNCNYNPLGKIAFNWSSLLLTTVDVGKEKKIICPIPLNVIAASTKGIIQMIQSSHKKCFMIAEGQVLAQESSINYYITVYKFEKLI